MIKNIIKELKAKTSPRLYKHILSVTTVGNWLAHFYNVEPNKVILACLLHDFCKEDHLSTKYLKPQDKTSYIIRNKEIWHGIFASYAANDKFKITDTEIIQAIRYHTTACANLSDVGKILFIADAIDPLRNYKQLAYLQLPEVNLDKHYKKVFLHKLEFLKSRDIEIGPDTIEAYEQIKQ